MHSVQVQLAYISGRRRYRFIGNYRLNRRINEGAVYVLVFIYE